MGQLVIDIETIGTSDESVIAEIAKGITPPKNYSKAETIAAWEENEKPALVADAVAKTSFDGGLGRIICIGYSPNDNDVYCTPVTDNEQELLLELFGTIERNAPVEKIIGHNITWDLRFLYQRCVFHTLKPPPLLHRVMHAKPWDSEIGDTMLMWNPERDKKISLDKLCRILGVCSSKGELDGSKIGQAYKDGRLDEIAQYCKGDVEATRECYRRLTFS